MAQAVRIGHIGEYEGKEVTVKGWLYNRRSSGKIHFLQIRDGSGFIQGVAGKQDIPPEQFEAASKLGQESAVVVTGTVKKEPRAPFCGYELVLKDVQAVSNAVDYPITKKEHGDAFLMDNRHLWLRSMRQFAILRVRHTIIKAIRDFFDSRDFVLVDSPIFTPNACEGTTTLFETNYFDEKAYLTQSGQLYQEAAAMAFGKTYCFGPTFRAEKSKTRRHLTEFWMVEPEVAFMTLEEDMELAEDLLCTIAARVLEKHEKELKEILERDVEPLKRIQKPFPRISYDEAVKQIAQIRAETQDEELKKLLELPEGSDLGSPHETELTKRYDRPIMVHRYPAEVKAFYMKKDPANPTRALCVDVLAPEGYGEVIGGGCREESLELLLKEIDRHGLPREAFEWYLDLRRWGGCPHAGFGLGVERTVAWMCGLHHVRETIPFARTMDRLRP
ncbi:MAG: asparagine--tRNA ligase [Myxococcota bacterium]